MALAIVTDSNISLPKQVLEDLPIFIAPLEIHIDGHTYVDGADLTSEEFYKMISVQKRTLATSAPTPNTFVKAFAKSSKQYDEIICITLASKLSATYASAQQAIQIATSEQPSKKIKLIDSNTAGLAQGLMVLNCARLAKRGYGMEFITAKLKQTKGSYSMIGCLGSLDYLAKSGRIPNIFKWLSNAASIKPIIEFSSGEIKMASRRRGMPKAIDWMVAMAKKRIGGSAALGAVMHSGDYENAIYLSSQLQAHINFKELFITELSPVIGAHVGNGLVGCAFTPIAGS